MTVSSEAVERLACPHCSAAFSVVAGTLVCLNGHSFDVARHGYVNLLPGDARVGTADAAEMVAARARFLGGGYFAPIAEKVAEVAHRRASEFERPVIIEIGAGTGYYLAHALDTTVSATGLALDVSKYAARRAARAHANAIAAVCDTWRGLPVRSAVAAVVLDVFAPRNAEEIARVLAPGGALVVVTPAPDHLTEAVEALGMLSVDADKEQRLDATLSAHFDRESVAPLKYAAKLDSCAVADLVLMGPSARHLSTAEIAERVAMLPAPVTVTVAVEVAAYRRRG